MGWTDAELEARKTFNVMAIGAVPDALPVVEFGEGTHVTFGTVIEPQVIVNVVVSAGAGPNRSTLTLAALCVGVMFSGLL